MSHSRVTGSLLLVLLASSSALASPTCSVSATPLNFGTVQGIAGASERSTATLSVTCRADTAANISYSLVYDAGSGVVSRTLQLGAAQVAYQLYTGGNDSLPWSDSHPITDSYSLAAGASVTRTYTVYAKLQPGRQGAPGAYWQVGQVRLIY